MKNSKNSWGSPWQTAVQERLSVRPASSSRLKTETHTFTLRLSLPPSSAPQDLSHAHLIVWSGVRWSGTSRCCGSAGCTCGTRSRPSRRRIPRRWGAAARRSPATTRSSWRRKRPNRPTGPTLTCSTRATRVRHRWVLSTTSTLICFLKGNCMLSCTWRRKRRMRKTTSSSGFFPKTVSDQSVKFAFTAHFTNKAVQSASYDRNTKTNNRFHFAPEYILRVFRSGLSVT